MFLSRFKGEKKKSQNPDSLHPPALNLNPGEETSAIWGGWPDWRASGQRPIFSSCPEPVEGQASGLEIPTSDQGGPACQGWLWTALRGDLCDLRLTREGRADWPGTCARVETKPPVHPARYPPALEKALGPSRHRIYGLWISHSHTGSRLARQAEGKPEWAGRKVRGWQVLSPPGGAGALSWKRGQGVGGCFPQLLSVLVPWASDLSQRPWPRQTLNGCLYLFPPPPPQVLTAAVPVADRTHRDLTRLQRALLSIRRHDRTLWRLIWDDDGA